MLEKRETATQHLCLGRVGARICGWQREEREKEIEMSSSGKLKSSSSELDLDGPNIEDYLPSGSTIQQQPHGKLRLYVFL